MCVCVFVGEQIYSVQFLFEVFKIYRVGTQQYDQVFNIRDLPQKQLNLNFCSNDIQWNPRDGL